MTHGREKSGPAMSRGEADERSRATGRGAGGAKGGGPRGMLAGKARSGHSARSPRHKRWSAYGKPQGFAVTPEVGAGCLNRARPVLCGGRPVMGVPTAIALLYPNLTYLGSKAQLLEGEW
jgi:hypothetical protein